MTDEVPFCQLMTALRLGDGQAARVVFERYARRLIGLAATRLPSSVRSKVDPEDVVQSAVRSEVTLAGSEEDSWVDREAVDAAPTPVESLLLAETLDSVLRSVREPDRPILSLRLQGYTVPEISNLVGRSERTVHRILEGVR